MLSINAKLCFVGRIPLEDKKGSWMKTQRNNNTTILCCLCAIDRPTTAGAAAVTQILCNKIQITTRWRRWTCVSILQPHISYPSDVSTLHLKLLLMTTGHARW